MNRRIIWLCLCACLLLTACSIQKRGVSNGDEVILSEALQGNAGMSAHVVTGASLDMGTVRQPESENSALASSKPSPTASRNAAAASAKPASATYSPIRSNKKVQMYDSTGTAVIGDTGFEIYNYVPSIAATYARAVNKAAKAIGTKANIYDLIVPTSVGITLPDNKKKSVGSSDQKESIRKMEKKLNKSVQSVSLYHTMMQHRTEYLYFRTDHHWTALGAYYAYQKFCNQTKRTPHALKEYKKVSFKSYIGTFYSDSYKNKNLRKDTLYAYYPISSGLSMQYRGESGKMLKGSVIENAKNYGISAKYCAFLGGDRSYAVITNKKVKDGSSCIVVKESFGNALVPYLADHYEKIYVIDYRYWNGKLSSLVKEKKVQDVLFVNNISMTRNAYLVGKLAQIAR